MKVAVIDIETTGLNPLTDRITEIGVVLLDDFQFVSDWSRLISCGVSIPGKITLLTGITDRMLLDQPGFEEVANELNELTAGRIIVGHRVRFDYSFIKNEMKRAGISYTRKTLCTAEFAQMQHPGLRSFSLASLCKIYGVTNSRPHRALPDALATAEIFRAMVAEKGEEFIRLLFTSTTESKLVPSHLRETVYRKLPATPGVYYFIGKNNKPVYIGKAAKIKSRVLSHFRGDGNSLKILAAALGIKEIRYQETGSELVATLLEDHEIRHYWPGLNAAQKRNITRFGIVYYRDQNMHWRMGVTRGGKQHCFEMHFHQYHLATEFVRQLAQQYRLDSSLCGLPSGEQVPADEHNRNFLLMMQTEKQNATAQVYFTRGRTDKEQAFIWIEKGKYKGFGFVPEGVSPSYDLLLENLTLRYSSITSETVIGNLQKQGAPSLVFSLK